VAAQAGAHFSERRADAEQYLDNPGFGGPNLATYEVSDRYTLDVRGPAGRAFEPLAEAYLDGLSRGSEREQEQAGKSAPRDVAERWRDSGYDYVFHVIENQRGAAKAIGRVYDWVRFTDDFPPGAITWRYLGTETLHPVSVEEDAEPPARLNRSRRRPSGNRRTRRSR
jgi:hypothetical protein